MALKNSLQRSAKRNLFLRTLLVIVTLLIQDALSDAKGKIHPHKSRSSTQSGVSVFEDYEHDPFVDYAVRLMGCSCDCDGRPTKVSLQAGRLEMFYKNEWGTICNDGFGLTDAHVACYSLGYTRYEGTSIRESFGPGKGALLLAGMNCTGSEEALNQCRHRMWTQVGDCQHSQDVSLACTDATESVITGYPTRLVNTLNNNTMMGRVEIYHRGCWGTVCNDGFTEEDATIACRSVDPKYRKGRMVVASDELAFGPGSGQIWLDNVRCNTSIDINIGYCAHDPWGVHDCHHEEDVAVICQITGCDLNPCTNGATCVHDPDDVDAYTCDCVDGYYGQHCEQDRCMNISCNNSGTCQITGDLCLCPPHYRGEYCEIMIGGCESSPCLNEATCNEFEIEYNCTCNVHYTGPNCETVIGGCESSPCEGNSTCIEDGYNYSCACEPGISGVNCERPLYGCEIERCYNEGTCIVRDIFEFDCICPPYYTGLLCESEIGGCDAEPCVNGATCEQLGINYTCSCPPLFTGRNCEGIIGGCEDEPCVNGATCIENGQSFNCQCAIGWTGMYCESQRPPSECGNYLHWMNITGLANIPSEATTPGNWTTMCYLGNSVQDKQFYDLTCLQTVTNSLGGTGDDINLNPNMYIGCWFSTIIPNDDNMFMACKRQDLVGYKNMKMSSNSSFVMMAVCIEYSPWPWPGSYSLP